MPLTTYNIEPTKIAQNPVPPDEAKVLECVSNLTLANLIRQLSSLSIHASRIFDELSAETRKITIRSQVLTQRIQNLNTKCAQFNYKKDRIDTLGDRDHIRPYRSSNRIEQQLLSRENLPDAMRIMYEKAEQPPALEKFNTNRSEIKDCMLTYSDPDFFYEAWCNDLMKNATGMKPRKRNKNKSSKPKLSSSQEQDSDQLRNQQQFSKPQDSFYVNISTELNDQEYLSPPPPTPPQRYSVIRNESFDDTPLPIPLPPPAPAIPPPLPPIDLSDLVTALPVTSPTPPAIEIKRNLERPPEKPKERTFLDDISSGKFQLKSKTNIDELKPKAKFAGGNSFLDNKDVTSLIDRVQNERNSDNFNADNVNVDGEDSEEDWEAK